MPGSLVTRATASRFNLCPVFWASSPTIAARWGGVRRFASAALAFGCAALGFVPSALGSASILNTTALSDGPRAVAVDSAGNVYVTIFEGASLTRIGSDGAPPYRTTTIGTYPVGLALDSAGNIYTANRGSNTVTKVTPAGTVAGTFATDNAPSGIAIDPAGNLFTSNSLSSNVTKITPAGVETTPFAAAGALPSAVASDLEGNIYVTNYSDSSVTKVTRAGSVERTFATASYPTAVTVDSEGNVYTASDPGFGTSEGYVSKFTPGGVLSQTYTVGPNPQGITIDSAGNVFTANAELAGGSGSVTKVAPDGTTSTISIAGGVNPMSITVDADGNLYTANINSNDVTRIIGEAAPSPPAQAGAPRASAGDGSAQVTATVNASDKRYGQPTSYLISTVQDPSKSCVVTVPATSCTVSGLTNGTAYTFTSTARLNRWVANASVPSGAVTPSVSPTPTPGPTPSNAFRIGSTSVSGSTIRTRVRVPGAGRLSQRATRSTRGASARALVCTDSRRAARAGTLTLTCRVNSAARNARRRGSVRVLVRTTFTPTGGIARSTERSVVLPRRKSR